MTKAEAIAYLTEKVADDEPVFLLRGADRVAEKTIRCWAQFHRDAGGTYENMEKAMEVALAVGRWRAENRKAKDDVR